MADKGQSKSTKDKEMAARLKNDPALCERWTGRCAICGAIIRNGMATMRHYDQHARGYEEE